MPAFLNTDNKVMNGIKTLGRGIAGIASFVGREILWRLAGTPDILLGIIPIYTAQRYEVAKSHDKMKYRAVAGQFFAHQRGGNIGFKAVLYLIGPESLDYLTYIQALHILGDAASDEITALKNNGSPAGLVNSTIAQSVKDKKLFKKDDNSWKTVETHHTFTIVTKEEIMHNMYIETVLYERDVTLGDAIKVTLLCRKYIKPPEVVSVELVNNSGTTISAASAKNQLSSGVYAKTTKDIKVGYAAQNIGKINAIGLTEQALHRWYVKNYADPYTDLDVVRTVAGRLNGMVYGINGSFSTAKFAEVITENWSTISEEITDAGYTKIPFVAVEVNEGNKNSKLKDLVFNNANTLDSIKIVEPKDAKLLKTMDKGDLLYDLSFSTPNARYSGKCKIHSNGILELTDLLKGEFGPLKYSTGTHAYLAPEDYSFILLFYKNSDSEYEVYTYTGEVTNGDYLTTIEGL